MVAAITSGVAQFFAHKPTHETLLATGAPIVATPSARELLTPTQELTATSPAAMPELSAASLTAMPELSVAWLTAMPELSVAWLTGMPELSAAPSTVTPGLTSAPMPEERHQISNPSTWETTRPPKKPQAQKFTPIKAPQTAGRPGTMSISTAKALATYAPRPQYFYEARSRHLQAGECALSKSMREAAALPAP